jgi:hypothetical protein
MGESDPRGQNQSWISRIPSAAQKPKCPDAGKNVWLTRKLCTQNRALQWRWLFGRTGRTFSDRHDQPHKSLILQELILDSVPRVRISSWPPVLPRPAFSARLSARSERKNGGHWRENLRTALTPSEAEFSLSRPVCLQTSALRNFSVILVSK